MRLRTGTSLWIDGNVRHFKHCRCVDRDLHCDVAVVGGGVSGALAACHLAKRGLDVVLVDRRQPGAGSTAACTALVQWEVDSPLIDLTRRYGEKDARQAYRTCFKAADWLSEHVESLPYDCGVARRPTLQLAKKSEDVRRMKAEVTARQSAGLPSAWLSASELRERYGIRRPGAIRSDGAVELDPYRLTVESLNLAVRHGAGIHAPAEVREYEFADKHVTLTLAHGPIVRAKQVVITTGYETPPFLRDGVGALLSTWAAASQPVELGDVWPERQLIWEWGKAYLYARTTPDNRVVYGGADARFVDANRRDALIESKTATLTRRVNTLLPGLRLTPDYAWAGTFAESPDGLPYIGEHEDHPNAYLCLGYGGNGVLFSLMAARIVTGIITGDRTLRSPARLFRLDR